MSPDCLPCLAAGPGWVRGQISRKLPPHTYTDLLRAGAAWLVFITDMPKYHKCLFSKFQAPSSSQLHQLYDG